MGSIPPLLIIKVVCCKLSFERETKSQRQGATSVSLDCHTRLWKRGCVGGGVRIANEDSYTLRKTETSSRKRRAGFLKMNEYMKLV